MSTEHNGVAPYESLFRKVRYGEDVIIENLDTDKFLSYLFVYKLFYEYVIL
jgi:hypothetical protein